MVAGLTNAVLATAERNGKTRSLVHSWYDKDRPAKDQKTSRIGSDTAVPGRLGRDSFWTGPRLRSAIQTAVSLHSPEELDERSQWPRLLQRRVPSFLPVQSLR